MVVVEFEHYEHPDPWVRTVVALADRLEAALAKIDPDVHQQLFRADFEELAMQVIGPPGTDTTTWDAALAERAA